MSTADATRPTRPSLDLDAERRRLNDFRDLARVTLDARGQKVSPAALPGFHTGRVPRNKGRRYEPDPPTAEEIVRLLEACNPAYDHPRVRLAAQRRRAAIAVLWRTGLRVSELFALLPRDLQPDRKTIVVRHGKGDKRRIVVMDDWGWQALRPWLDARDQLPYGPIFCVVSGPTAGSRPWSQTQLRHELRQAAERAGIKRRIAPHQLRHAFAVDGWREQIPELTLGKQLGHARLDVTQAYLRALDVYEVADRAAQAAGHARPAILGQPARHLAPPPTAAAPHPRNRREGTPRADHQARRRGRPARRAGRRPGARR